MRKPDIRTPARRLGSAFAALVAAAALILVAPAAPAAAATCYGGAVTEEWLTVYQVDLGEYVTSTRCRDINFRSLTNSTVEVCVIFVRHTSNCNYHTWVGSNWKVIASNVRDGTRFVVHVFGTSNGGATDRAQVAF